MPAVLIIEDETNIRLFLSANLEVRGYTVFEAGTAADGLALLRAHRPDVTILDMRLPDRTGADVLAEMADDDSLRALPVILMTASASTAATTDLRYANLVERLTKPCSVDMLLAAVQRAIA